MNSIFDKPACQNLRKALRKEWLLTNGLGDYASGTIIGCNTRKYHGLLVVNTVHPAGRHVMLSTLEESLCGGGKEFFFSCRKHPGVYFPRGHEYLEGMEVGDWPIFYYRIGNVSLKRELLMLRRRSVLLVRYTVCGDTSLPPLTLRLKPLLACRHFHSLTHATAQFNSNITSEKQGFSVQPVAELPALHFRASGMGARVTGGPDWYYTIDYLREGERGFEAQEDLFMPAMLELPIMPNQSLVLAVGTEPMPYDLPTLWEEEAAARVRLGAKSGSLQGHLRREGARFLVNLPAIIPNNAAATPQTKPLVLAGYHWFDAWGRDSLIALSGLTFAVGRRHKGAVTLKAISDSLRHGLIPNLFAINDQPAAYNSVDASLWYVWAVQQMMQWQPDETLLREVCWPAIKAIVDAFRAGIWQGGQCLAHVHDNGLLCAGNEKTQLTWMDANVNGIPVTPRHGCPVEINALWYNALALSNELAQRFAEPEYRCPEQLEKLRASFRHCFWVEQGNYLGDVWRDGVLDASIRPNQVFAVSLPYSVLPEDDCPCVVETVRNSLLTPYGLRTLSPLDTRYQGMYEGNAAQRDSAYHQGTVWPWLLGAYGDALLKTAWDVEGAVQDLLHTISPLLSSHLHQAGVGSISEIFDGNPPHTAHGCIAQAWSVAECSRLLRVLQQAAPAVYARWETQMGWH